MRSRMSRGVSEWSVGKDLYMGSPVLDTGSVLGVIGNVQGPPEGFGGPPGGATSLGGLRGCDAPDSIVRIPIPCSISLPASHFTRTVMHDPVTKHLVTLSSLRKLGRSIN